MLKKKDQSYEQQMMAKQQKTYDNAFYQFYELRYGPSPGNNVANMFSPSLPPSLFNPKGQPPVARKFKDNDRVKCIGPGTTITDAPGTVRGYNSDGFYTVELDTMAPGLHDCHRAVPNGQGYYLKASDLEALPMEAPKPKAVVNFDSVIISKAKRQQILEALHQIDKEKLIFETWGFGETIEKGKGLGFLFYGEPGSGKTLMCQAVAHKLDRKLKVISTADIESSKPGEAERNIREAFADAKKDKSILLFDECDSLLYSRQGVGAILGAQINELLTQMERHEGVTLFTTNRLGTLDEAMNRRLALKLHFGMPTQEERVMIWQRMFPKKAPLSNDVDFDRLSVVEITGGYIKNAVLRAARMAAIAKGKDEDKQITQAHLVAALKLEAESMMEFQKARDQEQRGIGVARHSSGRNFVTSNDKERP